MVLSQLISRPFYKYPSFDTNLFLNYIQSHIKVISISNNEYQDLFNLKFISYPFKESYALNVAFQSDFSFKDGFKVISNN
ncbi:MAG: hypothetical protein PWQ15_994 [Methanobacterium sp.]|jgi:hypothetical protein|nr:hypothetical protein [Methanobacterium sp.]CDG65858.1 hypothetical protein MBMB1_1779 [Methanobacterium sp. MB1]